MENVTEIQQDHYSFGKMRTLQCELNVLTRADGSALFCQGETVITASVTGPVEIKQQKMMIDKATVETYYRPKAGMPGVNDRLIESIIGSGCETAILTANHPRAGITINVQEMQDSGGVLACGLNACCLALIDSGLPLKFLFGAVSCILNKNNKIILDPGPMELIDAVATFTFVFDSIKKGIIVSQTEGLFNEKQYFEAINICRQASIKIFDFYRDVVKQYMLK